ncbi:GNAT family N-acetyltransferase [Breznakia pachnodae]|uniref:GNAT family N-acetyltransferase n=1 Tax=Breznakia pachnodae TaxID=265178 RepID=UPI0035227E50
MISEVVNEILNYLFIHDIEYVWACCFKENISSKKLIEKLGFILQQEGNFYSSSLDKTFDSYEYCLTKSQWKSNHK